ncbi:MAG TPA: hypothetical protein VJ810_13870, partial [Blastocatellia bacterium]|nr:hypothetical protein [Blastocatellia bacterium]
GSKKDKKNKKGKSPGTFAFFVLLVFFASLPSLTQFDDCDGSKKCHNRARHHSQHHILSAS